MLSLYRVFEENPKKMGRIYGPKYGAWVGPQLGPIVVKPGHSGHP